MDAPAGTTERRMIMYKYFVSYFHIKKGLFNSKATIGNAFFESKLPLCVEVVREFEKKEAEASKCKKCVALSVQMLPAEGE